MLSGFILSCKSIQTTLWESYPYTTLNAIPNCIISNCYVRREIPFKNRQVRKTLKLCYPAE